MTDSRAPVRLGFVGCGRATQELHLPALRRLPEAQVAAAADVDPERLRRVANLFQIGRLYADYRVLMEDSRVDAVAVCAPPRYHAEIALAALQAGKHVFIEKPLAASVSECDRLIERAARAPQKTMVGFNLRWHRLLRRARDLIAQGAMGRVELIRTSFTIGATPAGAAAWRARRESGGGVLAELGVHHFDLWRYLTGSEVEDVFAVSRSGEREDETAVVAARLSGGALASAVLSEDTGNTNDVEICGRSGRLRISCYRFDGFERADSKSLPGGAGSRLRKMTDLIRELPHAVAQARRGGYFLATYQAEWRHFLDAIRRDRPVESTLEDGRRAQQALAAAATSVCKGQPVRVG